MSKGIVYVAFGKSAWVAAWQSIQRIRRYTQLPILVATDSEPPYTLENVKLLMTEQLDDGARWNKLDVLNWTPFTHTLYLDADTVPYRADFLQGFEVLADGYDLIIVPSRAQDTELLWHIPPAERETTLDELGFHPLQLQAGVMWLNNTTALKDFFDCWKAQWERWRHHDQAAFLRALYNCPIKLWLFGQPFNGGHIVGHRHGSVHAD